MLIGYVSDEKYLALCDVALEFVNGGESFEARSRASGAVHADVPPDAYSVALQKPGFGQKRVKLTVAAAFGNINVGCGSAMNLYCANARAEAQ